MIESTCVVMQNDGEPYVADFTVFFLIESAPEKDQKSCFNQSINQSIDFILKGKPSTVVQ